MTIRLHSRALVAPTLLAAFGLGGCGGATTSAPPTTLIVANDNRVPGGKLKHDTLSISLEARTGQWQPEGNKGKSLDVAAWAEAGKPMQNPGPLIRVPAGTEVRATLKNTLGKQRIVYGFGATRGVTDSVIIAPGASQDVHFNRDRAGHLLLRRQGVSGAGPGSSG